MDPLTIVVWSVGVVAMAAASWLQDRRDVRREEGALTKFREELESRVDSVEGQVGTICKEFDALKRLLEKTND